MQITFKKAARICQQLNVSCPLGLLIKILFGGNTKVLPPDQLALCTNFMTEHHKKKGLESLCKV